MKLGTMWEAVKARQIIAAFRRRSVAEREAVGGFWSNLADSLESRLFRRMGWRKS